MTRAEPVPCRPADISRFEIVRRDGRARLGRFHTTHGVVSTPALLPVINPNIRTIPPREMWDDFGVEMLITNSYIIRGKDTLREQALDQGVHSLLDFPGAVMTDSGTFQSYVYGEVEVDPEEIVGFQRDIGVDVATMLDVFGRPDMDFEESAAAVRETAARAERSLEAAGETMLNGPIQGGLFPELRAESATSMAAHAFAVHPIGGIVPLMEQRRYRELARIITSCRHLIPPQRPVHLFGCGHPHLFPLAVALGVDFFDSAAYALFARDGRLIVPWGTLKLEDIEEWPVASRYLCEHTPAEVRAMEHPQREALLARFNLEVTLAELARAREAVRRGRIWELVERKAAEHPALGEALAYLLDTDSEMPAEFRTWLDAASNPLRRAGILWSPAVRQHPWAIRAAAAVQSSWRIPARDAFGDAIESSKDWNLMLIDRVQGPWRERCGQFIEQALQLHPATLVMLQTPLGIIPYTLEDLNPFAHFTGPRHIWTFEEETLDHDDWASLTRIDGRTSAKDGLALLASIFEPAAEEDRPTSESVTRYLDTVKVRDKLLLFTGLASGTADAWLDGCTFVKSSTGRVKNVIDREGRHILSPRLNDGGLSLTIKGARFLLEHVEHGHCTIPVLIMDEDSTPFIRDGRNAMHGFISEVRGVLIPGFPCLLESPDGELIGHGISRCTNDEVQNMTKGIAVSVKAGVDS